MKLLSYCIAITWLTQTEGQSNQPLKSFSYRQMIYMFYYAQPYNEPKKKASLLPSHDKEKQDFWDATSIYFNYPANKFKRLYPNPSLFKMSGV